MIRSRRRRWSPKLLAATVTSCHFALAPVSHQLEISVRNARGRAAAVIVGAVLHHAMVGVREEEGFDVSALADEFEKRRSRRFDGCFASIGGEYPEPTVPSACAAWPWRRSPR